MSRPNFRFPKKAPVYSVIALSRQTFCSYTYFIFSQRKDGENVAECYKTIEYPDRKAIAALYAAGAKARQIAKEIGVSPRSIYAELKRGLRRRPGPEARPGKPSTTRPEERRAGRMTPRARQRRTRRRIRKAAGYLSLIAFLALLGSVGAVEQDLVPLLPGTIRMFGFLLIWAGLLTVAGAFDTTEGRRERRR